MKILCLRFQNLNSLRGTNEIDFEHGPLGAAGLFAITGPTGAGKSTLLDAITLALYGRAARYGSQPSPETMMSRHTGECFAELDFSCASGRFRSSWTLQRAHKKPTGKLQQAKRRVSALPGGEVLAEKTEESGQLIEKLTGLDYERFLRSVMLAQGDFAAFLRAKPDERANLLEQVTGTEVYRLISTEAFQRCARAKAAHEVLLGQGANIQVLDTAERERMLGELAGIEAGNVQRGAALQSLRGRLEAVSRRLEWERADQSCREALADHGAELGKAAGELGRLALSERARQLLPQLGMLDRCQETLRGQRLAQERNRGLQPSLAEALSGAEAALATAVASLEAGNRRQEELQALWLRVQVLDTKLSSARQSLTGQAEALSALLTELQAASAKITVQERELEETRKVMDNGRLWLEANAADGRLEELLPAARTASQAWAEASRRRADQATRIKTLETQLAEASRGLQRAERSLVDADAALAPARRAEAELSTRLTALLPPGGLRDLEGQVTAARLRHEALVRHAELARRIREGTTRAAAARDTRAAAETALRGIEERTAVLARERDLARALLQACKQALGFAERCSALVSHRPHLVDGRECPLCGSTHHPWAHRADEDLGELVRARQAEADAEAQLGRFNEAWSTLQKELGSAQQRLALSEQTLATLTQEELRLQADWAQAEPSLPAALSPSDEEALRTLVSEALSQEQALGFRLEQARSRADDLAKASAALQELVTHRERAQAEHAKEVALHSQWSVQRGSAQEALREAGEEEERLAAQARLLLASQSLPSTADQAAYADLLDSLQRKASLHARALQKLQTHSQRHALAETTLLHLRETEQQLRLKVDEARGRQAADTAEFDRLSSSRRELFGDDSIDASRVEAKRRLDSLTEARSLAENGQREAASRLAACEAELQRLGLEIHAAEQECSSLAAALGEASLAAGFPGQDSLRAALLPAAEHERLLVLRRGLEERGIALRAEQARLAAEMVALAPGSAADATRGGELREELSALESQGAEATRKAGALDQCIRTDDTNRAKLGALLSATEAAHREFSRWDALRSLIGSADGSLFARFAQGLTLDRLAWLANRHLLHLNPRYSVQRSRGGADPEKPKAKANSAESEPRDPSKEKPAAKTDNKEKPKAEDLELEIVDHYQADVLRPMGSLSGGECFLVSLALALALSELASGKSAIESLFIDEGFGSLDADTLEAAMSALESLQSRGKTIGVISHVAVMQERIATQIRVVREAGGCSRIVLSS